LQLLLDNLEGVAGLLGGGFLGFGVGYVDCAIFGGYGGFWVET
jgi:hypothetical protein